MTMKCWAIATLAGASFINLVYFVVEISAKGILLASLPLIFAALWFRLARHET